MSRSATASRTAFVAILALGVRLAWVRLNGIDVPIGPDSALWVLAGIDRYSGSIPHLPPLYPSFVALALALGASGEVAARWLSLLAGAAIAPALTAWLDRRGVDPVLSLAMGIFLALMPDLVFESSLVQPDSLTQLWILAFAAAGLLHLRERSGRTAGALVGLSALGVVLRETALPLIGLGTCVLALAPGPGRYGRLVWPLAVIVAAHLAPVALGLWPSFPLSAAPWGGKAGVPQQELMRVLREGYIPSYSAKVTDTWYLGQPNIHLGIRDHYDKMVNLSVPQRLREVLWLHATRAMELSRELYALLIGCAVAILAGARREKRPFDALFGVALLAPVLVTVVVWTQRRHVVAFVPAALLCAGLALPRALGPKVRSLLVTALFVALCAQARVVDPAMRWTARQVSESRPMAELGREIAEKADGRSVIAGISRANVTQYPGVLVATAGLRASSSMPDDALRWSVVWVLLDDERAPTGWTPLTRGDRLIAYVWGAEVPRSIRECMAGQIERLAPLVDPFEGALSVVRPGQGCGDTPQLPGGGAP